MAITTVYKAGLWIPRDETVDGHVCYRLQINDTPRLATIPTAQTQLVEAHADVIIGRVPRDMK